MDSAIEPSTAKHSERAISSASDPSPSDAQSTTNEPPLASTVRRNLPTSYELAVQAGTTDQGAPEGEAETLKTLTPTALNHGFMLRSDIQQCKSVNPKFGGLVDARGLMRSSVLPWLIGVRLLSQGFG